MGARGPLGKTSAAKERSGNAGHRRTKKPARPRPVMPPKPQLSKAASEIWDRIGPELVRIGRMTVVDGEHFSAYCCAAADYMYWRRAVDRLKTRTQKTPKGYDQIRPEVAEMNRALDHMERLGRGFGLTPGARGDEGIPPPAGEREQEEADTFFAARRSPDVPRPPRPVLLRSVGS